MDISAIQNSEKIAIVAVGYNRINAISRLLQSLQNAKYPSNDIPLVICIDCSGNQELYNYVRQFEWQHGEKYVIIQEQRLGLKEHILRCGDLSQHFKAIILLEDDIYVSPYFYNYVVQAVNKYGKEKDIAEISLYKHELNRYAWLPFEPVKNQADVFLLQDISTWGQCWTKDMWQSFREWLKQIDNIHELIQKLDIPSTIKTWENAWSPFFIAYVIENEKTVLYPHISLTTNFSEAGEHEHSSNRFQVHLLDNDTQFCYLELNSLERYDIYYNNEKTYNYLGIDSNQVCLDFYGINLNKSKKRYILSVRHLPYKIIKSYALALRPIELNIEYNLQGEGLYLFDTNTKVSSDNKYSKYLAPYYLRNFNTTLLFRRSSELKRIIRHNKIQYKYKRLLDKLSNLFTHN